MTAQQRPEGARIERGGDVIPLELAYGGVDADGIHQWISATPFNPATDRIRVDVLPGETSIVFDAEGIGG